MKVLCSVIVSVNVTKYMPNFFTADFRRMQNSADFRLILITIQLQSRVCNSSRVTLKSKYKSGFIVLTSVVTRAVLSQGGPRDVAVNFDKKIYNGIARFLSHSTAFL